jgi:hypothetical protein
MKITDVSFAVALKVSSSTVVLSELPEYSTVASRAYWRVETTVKSQSARRALSAASAARSIVRLGSPVKTRPWTKVP